KFAMRCVTALGLALLATTGPGCDEFDTDRDIPKRGSVGEEIYGVLCDRVAAQALHDDLTGGSARNVCHRSGGKFADKVDRAKPPPLDPEAVNEAGKPVSVEKQRSDRDRAVSRVEALGRRRDDLIRALDATFPERKIPVKALDADDPTKSCGGGKG